MSTFETTKLMLSNMVAASHIWQVKLKNSVLSHTSSNLSAQSTGYYVEQYRCGTFLSSHEVLLDITVEGWAEVCLMWNREDSG